MALFGNMNVSGLVPNTITYNATISSCEKGDRPERANNVFEVMQRTGVVPNSISIDSFIVAGAASARFRGALAFLAEFLTRS